MVHSGRQPELGIERHDGTKPLERVGAIERLFNCRRTLHGLRSSHDCSGLLAASLLNDILQPSRRPLSRIGAIVLFLDRPPSEQKGCSIAF